jgi:hypothetical protein
MIAQKRFGNRHQASGSGFHSGHEGPEGRMRITALLAAAILASVVPAVGCKTGTSFAKPSWWTLGGTPKPEGDTLASAPPYGGAIAKPSESAKPYPTTTTPGGYVISGSAGPSATVAQQFEAPQAQNPVVYGTTPPPQSTPIAPGAATAAASPIAGSQQSVPPSIAPQVGPYAALGGDSIPPPGQPLPPLAPSTSTGMSGMSGMSGAGGMSPMPSETTLPNSAYSSFSGPAAYPAAVEQPPARMADARGLDPAAAIPAAALPAEAAAAYGGSRYSATHRLPTVAQLKPRCPPRRRPSQPSHRRRQHRRCRQQCRRRQGCSNRVPSRYDDRILCIGPAEPPATGPVGQSSPRTPPRRRWLCERHPMKSPRRPCSSKRNLVVQVQEWAAHTLFWLAS